MNQLFRNEALAHRRQRLLGDVLISQDRPNTLVVVGLCVVSACALLFATTGEYSRTETAPGAVVTTQPIAKVFASQPGIVTQVLVKEGQRVTEGQILAAISIDLRLDADHSRAQDNIASLDRQIALSGEQSAIVSASAEQERTQLHDQLMITLENSEALNAQHQLQEQIIASSEAMLLRIDSVAERGFISQIELERRRRELLLQKQQLAQIVQQQISIRAQQHELRTQISRIGTQKTQKLGEIASDAETMAQQRYQARAQSGYVVSAPITGTVTGLNAAVGKSTADPRFPLLSIIPDGARFEAELFAPSRAVGFLQVGQEIRVMYDAFPYKKFGSFQGEVAGISPVIATPAETEGSVAVTEPTYRVRVRLKDQAIAAAGRRIPLQSGMALSGNIVLERRTFIDWLLDPVRAVKNRTQ